MSERDKQFKKWFAEREKLGSRYLIDYGVIDSFYAGYEAGMRDAIRSIQAAIKEMDRVPHDA